MVNYGNGKIYKLISNNSDKIYIGSTCQSLAKRKAKHKEDSIRYNNGKYHYVSSFELFNLGDVDVILLENYPCKNKEELHARERFYIEENLDTCVNVKVPNRTKQEYRKKRYTCTCGKEVLLEHKGRHEKSLKHQTNILL